MKGSIVDQQRKGRFSHQFEGQQSFYHFLFHGDGPAGGGSGWKALSHLEGCWVTGEGDD